MIEFVYFDLGNVLWSFEEKRACQNAAILFGVAPNDIHQAVYLSGLQNRFEHGLVTPLGFANELSKSLAGAEEPASSQLILDALSDMFTPIESMVGVIASVREAGKRVGILSNTCDAHWDWIDRQQHDLMTGPFDAVVLSHEVNSMKPDDQIYRAAELVAGVPTDQILFLDDKAENVQAAKMRGWKAEQCLGGDEAVAALRGHDVIGSNP